MPFTVGLRRQQELELLPSVERPLRGIDTHLARRGDGVLEGGNGRGVQEDRHAAPPGQVGRVAGEAVGEIDGGGQGRAPAELRYLKRRRYDMRCFTSDLLISAVHGEVEIERDRRPLGGIKGFTHQPMDEG